MRDVMRRCVSEGACCPCAYLAAVADEPYPVLLESTQRSASYGRYSILCWRPFRKITCRGTTTYAEDLATGKVVESRGDPFRFLSEQFGLHRVCADAAGGLPFVGGAVGYFSYDLRHRIEKLPRRCAYDLDVPELCLCFYDQALVFDHARGVTEWVGLEGATPRIPEPMTEPARVPELAPIRLESDFTRAEYLETVRRAKDYIAAGDIFQVNVAQRFTGPCAGGGLAIYERLRQINPAPFAAYLKHPGFEVVSVSPERFLLLDHGRVTTRPIKGTRPRRAGDEAFNARMRADLLASAKDLSELTMIVDLERNDLGKACSYGTVRVEEHAVIEEHPTVFHLVSTVAGRLHMPAHDEFSLLRAAFPGGSITGAPKIRAMEIIEGLERHARNVYTGAIGYVSFHGRMDLNIAIRTMVVQGGRAYAHFGGGIVADSDPEMEYEETLHKGRAFFEALNAADCDDLMGAKR